MRFSTPFRAVVHGLFGDGRAMRSLKSGLLTLLCLGLCLGPADAQLPEQTLIAPPFTFPIDVRVADIDGDQAEDLLFATESGQVGWVAGGGDEFAPLHRITREAGTAQAVLPADLDGDGDQDVIVATEEPGEEGAVKWYENSDGAGSFSEAISIMTSTAPQETVDAADLDDDGDVDVVAGGSSGEPIAWYENTDGSGSFSGANVVNDANDSILRSVQVADLNGTGAPDFVAAIGGQSENRVVRHENTDGNGTFSPADTITTALELPRSVRAADFDGDDDLDVVSAAVGFSGGGLSWYENLGEEGFSAPNAITGTGSVSAYAADLDGDGDQDLLTASSGDFKVAWHENTDGEGSFSDQNELADADDPTSVFAADVRENADPEVFFTSAGTDEIGVQVNRLNSSEGDFSTPIYINDEPGPMVAVEAADFDGDGDPDMAAAENETVWYENDGPGEFSLEKTVSDSAASDVHTADLDGDGDRDLLTASSGDGTVTWYENLDDGLISGRNVIATHSREPNVVETADLDEDGDQDVLAGLGKASFDGEEQIVWYENVDGGGFSAKNVILQQDVGGVGSLSATDLDGDDDREVLAAVDFIGMIWFENLDSGGFSTQNEFDGNDERRGGTSILAVDLDGDGDQDVVTASPGEDGSGPGLVSWHENLAPGGFSAVSDRITISEDQDDVRALAAGDLNGDGAPDVATSENPAWFKNEVSGREEGESGFSSRNNLTEGSQSTITVNYDVHLTDLEGDGDLDVLWASSDRIRSFENATGVLPVELAGLSAQTDGQQVTLTWQTLSETSNAGFAIERRREEGRWSRLGFVESTASGGTTTEPQSYRFVTEDLPVGTHTFRLRQVDIGGGASLSEPVSVQVKLDSKARLTAPAPNPVHRKATVSFAVKERAETTLVLYNMLGRQVATLYRGTPTPTSEKTVTLPAEELASGVYFLRLTTDGQTRTQKLTITH